MTKPTSFWPTLCVGLAATLTTFVLCSPPAAEAQGKKRFNVVQWEYRVFQMDPAEYSDKSDYRAILAREGARKAESVFSQHVLKHLGKQGWELVSLERLRTNVMYFYMKRKTP